MVIEPVAADVDLNDWSRTAREFLEAKLLEHAAILFRGFDMSSIADFEGVIRTLCPCPYTGYGDLPREPLTTVMYQSTPYPADKSILFHNEASHTHQWPMKQWFGCLRPPGGGGETPIADCRRLYRVLDTEVADRIATRRLRYVRNFIESVDVSWQQYFGTADRAIVKQLLGMYANLEWTSDGGLRIEYICDGIRNHPRTGEKVLFNQIQLHHPSYLDPEVRRTLLSLFGERGLPRNVYYGDGTALDPRDLEALNQAYKEVAVTFSWRRGDLLMVDNMLTAHARNPYSGQRKLVVAMGEMVSHENEDR